MRKVLSYKSEKRYHNKKEVGEKSDQWYLDFDSCSCVRRFDLII